MATPDYTAGAVMDTVGALMNDAALSRYTYAFQLPYLKQAFRQLREELQLQNVPVTNRVDTVLTLVAGTTEVSFVTSPALPEDLVEIRQLWERSAGVDPWTPMKRMEFLPYSLDGQESANFMIWAWINNSIKLLATSQDNDLKLSYIAQLDDIVDQNTTIGVINGRSFLENKTAATCARFMAEDVERADELEKKAQEALDRCVIIEAKGKQAIMTRRRPFRQSWKSRGSW